MKQPKEPKIPRAQMQAQIVLLQQIIGGLVARLGGEVEIGSRELDGGEGDRMEMSVQKGGVHLRLHRTIRSVSGLN